MKILIIGSGYIGTRCQNTWGDQAVLSTEMIYSVDDALKILDQVSADVVLNAAGIRGTPNVDWCETNQQETAFGNTVLPILLAQACSQRQLYLLHIGSGCVFYGDSPDPKGWKETDFANPISYYSKSKYAADLVLGNYPLVGVARIRVPLDNQPYPGNIVDKLASFTQVIDVENSITVIPDMIDVFYQLLEKKAEGIFHVTNPGAIKYRDIIKLYIKYVDPNHSNEWITEEELVKKGLVGKTRSTNKLQSANLEKFSIHMPPIYQAVEKAIKQYAQRLALK